MKSLQRLWQLLRFLANEDAYDNYCQHHRDCHSREVLLTKKAFFKQMMDDKWQKTQRCC